MQGWKMQVRKNQVQNKVQIATENTTKITLRTMRNNRAHTEYTNIHKYRPEKHVQTVRLYTCTLLYAVALLVLCRF